MMRLGLVRKQRAWEHLPSARSSPYKFDYKIPSWVPFSPLDGLGSQRLELMRPAARSMLPPPTPGGRAISED